MPLPDSARLNRLLAPRSIAIVGASSKAGSLGRRLLANLRRLDFGGDIFPVTSNNQWLDGVACYSTLEDLPRPVDVAVVCVRAEAVPEVLRTIAATDIRHVVVYAAGFGEVGAKGAELNAEIKRLAVIHDLVVAGPNCMGNVNVGNGVSTTFADLALWSDGPLRRGPVAVISQSGGMCRLLYQLGASAGLGFSHLISSGNEAVIDMVDYLDYLAADDETSIVCVYTEHLGRGRELLARAGTLRDRGKHLVILKGGRGVAGRQAAVSHTGAIAGNDAVTADFFEQTGIVKVTSPTDLISVARLLLSRQPLPSRGRLGFVASSGGTAVLAADLAEEAGLETASFTSRTRRALRALLPQYASAANPVDITAPVFHEPERIGSVVGAIRSDPNVDVLVVFSAFGCDSAARTAAIVAPVLGSTEPYSIAVWLAASDAIRATFRDNGVPCFDEPRTAFDALAKVIAARRAPGIRLPAHSPLPVAIDKARRVLTEEEVKAAIPGLVSPPHRLVHDADDAASAAEEIGFPVALKIMSPEVPHRTRAGGLALNVGTPQDVRRAYASLLATIAERQPTARLRGVLVQRMAPAAPEAILGISHDAGFGPIMTLAVGGAIAETRTAATFAMLPLSARAADAFVATFLRRASHLSTATRPHLTAAVRAVARWWERESSHVLELDLNPILLTDRAALVVDALAVIVDADRKSVLPTDGKERAP